MGEIMFVVIFDPINDRLFDGRKMGPHEKLDAAKFAAKTATMLGEKIDWTRTSFDGRGDIRVEFRPRKKGGFLKESQSYYFVDSLL